MSISTLTPSASSTRPYLLRALYEWCTDNGYTPYIAAYVDETVQVPIEHVKNNEIVLNISMDATSALKLGNEFIEFKARFSGSARQIMVPIDRVIAIYARENGQGMAFPVPQAVPSRGEVAEAESKIASIGKKSVQSVSETLIEASTSPSDSNVVVTPRVMQLVTPATATSPDTDPDAPVPPTAPNTSGARPALKRVK